MELLPLEPDRIVIVVNKVATSYKKGLLTPDIDELHQHYGDRAIEFKTSGEFDDDIKGLESVLKPGDLVVGAVGDGGMNMIAHALLGEQLIDQHIPLLPGYGGNGNNNSTTLNGKKHHTSLLEIIENGVITSYPTLRVTTTEHGQEPISEIAASYFGIGITGDVARRINRKEHRERRFYQNDYVRLAYESLICASSIRHTPPFEISELSPSDITGTVRAQSPELLPLPAVLRECSVSKIPKMAKFFDLPVNYRDESALVTYLESKPQVRYASVAKYLGSRALGKMLPTDQYITPSNVLAFCIESEQVQAHIDAEPRILKKGTTVVVELGDRLHVVSTELVSP
jgi:hypothetical protein